MVHEMADCSRQQKLASAKKKLKKFQKAKSPTIECPRKPDKRDFKWNSK